jgi:hypothetical protein
VKFDDTNFSRVNLTVDLGEYRVGVCLQRPLRHRRTVPVVDSTTSEMCVLGTPNVSIEHSRLGRLNGTESQSVVRPTLRRTPPASITCR